MRFVTSLILAQLLSLASLGTILSKHNDPVPLIFELIIQEPTIQPTYEPTVSPTTVPSVLATQSPSVQPSFTLSYIPTFTPTAIPSYTLTDDPSPSPTRRPTTGPRIPTRRPTRAPSTISPTATPVPTRAPTQRPSRVLPIIYANVEQKATLDSRVDVNNAVVVEVFREAIASAGGLTAERIQGLYFLELNSTATVASAVPSVASSGGFLRHMLSSLYHRVLLSTKSYVLIYTIQHVQTASFVTTTSITDSIKSAIDSGTFLTTLAAAANSSGVDLYLNSNTTSFDSALAIQDLTPSASPTKAPTDIFGTAGGMDQQTQLIVGIVVGIVGLVLMLACIAFVSVCLRKNCEEVKHRRALERQERRKQEAEDDAKAAITVEEVEAGVIGESEEAPHTLKRPKSGLNASFYNQDPESTPPLPPSSRSRPMSSKTRSNNSSGSDVSSANSPGQQHRKLRRKRTNSRNDSGYGSDSASFAGLNDSYQHSSRPIHSSGHGSDYGFTGFMADDGSVGTEGSRVVSGSDSVVSSSHHLLRPRSHNNSFYGTNSGPGSVYSVPSTAYSAPMGMFTPPNSVYSDPSFMLINGVPVPAQQAHMMLIQQQLQDPQLPPQNQQQLQQQLAFFQQQQMLQQQQQQQNRMSMSSANSVGVASLQPAMAPYVSSPPSSSSSVVGYPPRPPHYL